MHKHYICPLTGIFVMLNNCPSVQAKPNCTVPTTRSWTWSPRRPRAVTGRTARPTARTRASPTGTPALQRPRKANWKAAHRTRYRRAALRERAGGDGLLSLANSSWNSRRSFTVRSICPSPSALRLRTRSNSARSRSKSGSRTAGPNGNGSKPGTSTTDPGSPSGTPKSWCPSPCTSTGSRFGVSTNRSSRAAGHELLNQSDPELLKRTFTTRATVTQVRGHAVQMHEAHLKGDLSSKDIQWRFR